MCPRGCPGTVHRHDHYFRYADPEGVEQERIERYRCYRCGLTLSVLPSHRLPYRPIRVEQLEADFDCRAGIQTQGLDPPPRVVEAGCLQRAWSCFVSRIGILKEAFGQLIETQISKGPPLWNQLRQAMNSVAKMLHFLSEHHQISLLANYRCLLPPS